jgi:predicted dehydrogenase
MRIGVIGTGHWANDVHAAGIAMEPSLEFAGVWGRNTDKAAAITDRFGGQNYASPAAMFQDVDAVTFAVPPDLQAGLAIEAAESGCHLLLEKPPALDSAKARNLADAVAANGVATVVFFTSRFVPEVATWLDGARSTGGWVGAAATWVGSIFHPGNPFGASAWRREWGSLWDVGPHALSLILPVLGRVDDVTAVRGAGDTVHMVLNHENGGSSTMLLSLTVPQSSKLQTLSLYGEAGWLHLPETTPDRAEVFRLAAVALAESARTGRPHPCNIALGQEIVELLERAQSQLTSTDSHAVEIE